MTATEYQRAWDGWRAIKSLEVGKGTGRLAVFYEGHHHVFIYLSGGAIAAIDVSDRRLKVEQVMMRLAMISSDDIQYAFHCLEGIDRITPLSHILLEQGVITAKQLAIARREQMTEVLRTILVSKRDALMFVPGPVRVQKVEAIIHIDDALATAFAGFGLDSPAVHRVRSTRAVERRHAPASGCRFAVIRGDRSAPTVRRHAR